MVDILPKPARLRREKAPTSPDPIEIAMEAEQADESSDSPARRLLVNQNRLVGWQIASERAGFGLKMLIGLAGLGAAAVLAAMAWNASRAEGLVVESFSVPPALADKGLTGPVVAGEVLDQLARLDRENNLGDILHISDSWTVSTRVAIPQTGISLDDLDRLLRRQLGRETLVTGAVVETPDGITLTARPGNGAIVRAQGQVGDLPAMADQVAEQLLGQAQPLRYARLLQNRGQRDAARVVYNQVIGTSTSAKDRDTAYGGLGGLLLAQDRLGEARSTLLKSKLAGEPNRQMLLAWVEHGLGHEASAAEFAKRAASGAGEHDGTPMQRDQMFDRYSGHFALMTGDFLAADRKFRSNLTTRIYGGSYDAGHYQDHIRALIGLHQTSAARSELPAVAQTLQSEPRTEGFIRGLTVNLALADEDWPGLLTALDAGPPSSSMTASPAPNAFRALALARLGRLPEASQLAATLPGDCYRCLVIRAQVAEAAGDRAGADRWFAEAVRQAPKIPFAEAEWARVLLARADPAGAIAKARLANRENPNFADPVEVWGEALLAKGDAEGATKRFETAAQLAPHWGRLHLKWGQALARLGKGPEAQAQFRAVAGMDLTPTERTELARLQGAR